jgi:Fibronectin type III domain
MKELLSRQTAAQLAICVLALTIVAPLPPATGVRLFSAVPTEQSTPSGEVVVITVNAQQILTHSAARLTELASAVRNRPTAADGNYYAPDVLMVNETSASDLATFRDAINDLYPSHSYGIFGLTSDDVKSKFLVNLTTMRVMSARTWPDICIPDVRYQLINLRELQSDISVTVAGVHIRADYTGEGGPSCKNQNAIEARRQLAAADTRGSIVGDFNKRAMLLQRECDPEETSGDESWYTDMTSFSAVDNRSYIDSVRHYHRANNLSMWHEWTHEQKDLSTLCDGSVGYRRNRIDYIFVSDTFQPLEAHADHPGWANAEEPGTVGCTPAPDCKYSDHRFVWARVGLGSPPAQDITPPSDPTSLVATAGKRKISLSWGTSSDTGGSGLAGYEVWRSTTGAAGSFTKLTTTTATSYTNSGLTRGRKYWYYVVAYDNAGNRSNPSNTASATAS